MGLIGAWKAWFDVSNAKHLDDALPNSKLQILPEAGHLAWSDQPEMFASMITDWVYTEHKNTRTLLRLDLLSDYRKA